VSTTHDRVPPHYHALRILWTVLQLALLLIVAALVVQALPPGDLVGDVSDWARDLQDNLL
jgi:hypothetical protein